VPFSGSDAIWGPSCQYSAVLAAAEINESGGILGREIELFAVDAGGEPDVVVERARALTEANEGDVLIGVHLSSVRVALREAFGGRLPYVFAPLYEGGESTSGVFAIGETPDRQFPGPVEWLMRQGGAQRWFLIGNDYVWPRLSHRTVKRIIRANGGRIIDERYVPLGGGDFGSLLADIRAAKPDIVFESLVGTDCVLFNRAFSDAGLSAGIVRLSGAIEENTLLGIGAAHTKNLFCAAGYFSSLPTAENLAFVNRYRSAFGVNAPVQGVLSQSCYEAIHFFAALARRANSFEIGRLDDSYDGLQYKGARGTSFVMGGTSLSSTYLARANGTSFEVVRTF
jgi:ABC-type branched-subunit amino acid transport system substrate-binding protein